MKKTSFTPVVFLTLAGLNGCPHESDPSVARSTLRIEVAKRGDLQLPTGLLKQTIYIDKPALCPCDPNTEGNLFVLDAEGRSATQVNVQYGRARVPSSKSATASSPATRSSSATCMRMTHIILLSTSSEHLQNRLALVDPASSETAWPLRPF